MFIGGPYPHDEIVQFYDLIDIFVVVDPIPMSLELYRQ